jgi:hypothetical protein
MRIVMTAFAVSAASLILVGALGVASAETTTTTTPATTAAPPLRTVSVQGVATEPIEQSANAAAATAVYRQAMASAVSDGQTKAQFLASQVGATLGQVQSMAEGGGYIQCTGSEEGYLGEQPDFGSAGNYTAAPVASPREAVKSRSAAPSPAVKPRRKPKRRKQGGAAKQAAATTCTLATQVSLVYALS